MKLRFIILSLSLSFISCDKKVTQHSVPSYQNEINNIPSHLYITNKNNELIPAKKIEAITGEEWIHISYITYDRLTQSVYFALNSYSSDYTLIQYNKKTQDLLQILGMNKPAMKKFINDLGISFKDEQGFNQQKMTNQIPGFNKERFTLIYDESYQTYKKKYSEEFIVHSQISLLDKINQNQIFIEKRVVTNYDSYAIKEQRGLVRHFSDLIFIPEAELALFTFHVDYESEYDPSWSCTEYFLSYAQLSAFFNASGFRDYQRKDIFSAITNFEVALTFSPDHVNANYNLACMYALNTNTNLSIKYLQKLKKLNNSASRKKLKKAQTDKDFDAICEAQDFVDVIHK